MGSYRLGSERYYSENDTKVKCTSGNVLCKQMPGLGQKVYKILLKNTYHITTDGLPRWR